MHAVSQASPTVVYPKTLTRALKHLQDKGLVKHHHDSSPLGPGMTGRRKPSDYRLTAAGTQLVDLLEEIKRWTEEHHPQDDDSDNQGDSDDELDE
jgi:DNA-binding HxlR family transcriptional regulator